MACIIYKSLGRMFIFRIAALPNHEKGGLSHFCRSSLIKDNNGVKFKEYNSSKRAGSCMPRYVIALVFPVKGNFSGIEILYLLVVRCLERMICQN